MRNICDVGSQTCTTSFDTVVMSHALYMLNGGGGDSVLRFRDFGIFHVGYGLRCYPPLWKKRQQGFRKFHDTKSNKGGMRLSCGGEHGRL